MRSGLIAAAVVVSFVAAACSSGDAGGATATTTIERDSTTRSTDAVTDGTPDDESAGGSTGESDAPVSPTAEVATFEPAPIVWVEFDEQVDVATLEVPVDYTDPAGAVFELAIAKYNALDQDNRIGTLLVNRGGPGFSSTEFAFYADQIFDQELIERFDILAWDPRGVGESEPAIDCIDDYDRYFNEIDSTPESDAERQLVVAAAEDFAAECVSKNADIIDFVGTNSSARDIDSIRRALGEETISYFGFSYGSELGAAWATLFPDTFRAAVFDGATDPNADSLESSLQQSAGFESTLATFLAQCSARQSCEFHNDGNAEAAFDDLFDALDAAPVPGAGGRPPVNRDVATTGVIRAMYDEALWPALAISLAAAARGDGSGLLELADSYYERSPDGTYTNQPEAFQVISCADTPDRPSVAEIDAENVRFTEVAPRITPEGSVGGYFCTFLPPPADPRIDIDTTGAGPIVVIGTTGDPATPFESTVRMANALDEGRLVIVEAESHTGYGRNRCVVDVVNDYLIDLEAPTDETECR